MRNRATCVELSREAWLKWFRAQPNAEHAFNAKTRETIIGNPMQASEAAPHLVELSAKGVAQMAA